MRYSPRELHFDPPYARLLEGILSFKDLDAAENTLRRLENLRQRFLTASDKKGVEYCRQIALLGRHRAELIGHSRRVGVKKRVQKIEIALWFQIWLETPELFWDWLELRKKTAGYHNLLDFAAE
jgi:hypothetical protein